MTNKKKWTKQKEVSRSASAYETSSLYLSNEQILEHFLFSLYPGQQSFSFYTTLTPFLQGFFPISPL